MNTNFSAYKFIQLTDLESLRAELESEGSKLGLMGTALITPEGINLNLAGAPEATEAFKRFLTAKPVFSDLIFKESFSEQIPFQALKIKIKKEIITFRQDEIRPEKETVTHLPPTVFKQWLDEGRDITILDTRNVYEVEVGHFKNAIDLDLDVFTQFTYACMETISNLKDRPVVMYCTGGVRCEKAGPALIALGFKEVYQLEGGILAYFEQCGGAHFEGNCFVFDERVAVTSNLDVSEKK